VIRIVIPENYGFLVFQSWRSSLVVREKERLYLENE